MKIKVCGMGDSDRMKQISALQVDMLGFIFYPKSPRYVVDKINPKKIKNLPKKIKKVGVFVNASEDQIIEYAHEFRLDSIQLHGSEKAQLCKNLKALGYTVLKAFNLTKNNDFEKYAPYCDYFLFDTPSEQHGGTGQKFDWSLLDNYKGTVPFLLSGGIGKEDINEVLNINHPQLAGIDINSKFEIEPGIKDVEMIKDFLEDLNSQTA